MGEPQPTSVPSSEQVNDPASFEVNAKLAEVLATVPLGPEDARVVSGATVSTVQVRLAGVGSSLPATSRARTVNVWGPCERPEYVFGEPQPTVTPSSVQLNVPDSFEENSNSAEVLATAPLGPEVASEVSGATLSTVHCHVLSPDRLPLQSTARTWNV